MKIKLYPNNNTDSSFIADILKNELIDANFELSDDDYDLGIAIGGDGTFLHMVSQNNFNTDIRYIGINNGTLGFLQEIKPTELQNFIKCLKEKTFSIEKISFENIKVVTKNDEITFNSLNEVVIRDKNLSTAYYNVTVDGALLEKFVGDGLMISTPSGSTAYNMSSGGAVIYNGLHTLQITPIAPINNNIYRTINNPIVLPECRVVRLTPCNRTKDLMLLVDGVYNTFDDVLYVEIKISDKKLECLRMNSYDYTRILNDKFLN